MRRQLDLNTDWRFGAVTDPPFVGWSMGTRYWEALEAEAGRRERDDTDLASATLPHTVTPLGWRDWDPASWEKVWLYRRHITLPDGWGDSRVFLDFEAAMTNATVMLNGHVLGRHFGGYLPFSFEVTGQLQPGDNLLAVLLDSRFNLNVPPNVPPPVPSEAIDYWQPGGIYGQVRLRAVPRGYLSEVVVVPENVLDPELRRLRVEATVNGEIPDGALLRVRLHDASGGRLASGESEVSASDDGGAATIVVGSLRAIELWDVDSPTLYSVETELVSGGSHGEVVDTQLTRVGFREARFATDGFWLNGRRLYLFGTNRHAHFPFAGFAMPPRVQRRDVEIMKELGCVMVRCSHYPQLPAFLDACDELGLLVWEESAGWQYVGDEVWKQRALEDIEAMVRRDRNRPSVIIWGARLNETPDNPEFYARSEALVKSLDPTRATSGTMHGPLIDSQDFQHDVFSYDDYSIITDVAGDRHPTLLPPREDFPYLVAEAVTSWSSSNRLYRRADGALLQQHQAMDFAHVHNAGRANPRITGVLGWSGFDYLAGHVVNHRGVKTSGLIDLFRNPKPGAAIYRAQRSTSAGVVLEGAFTWDPPGADEVTSPGGWGPGEQAMLCSNCDRIEVFLDGRHHATAYPDREGFPFLVAAPFFVDLRVPDGTRPDLRLDGYLGDALAISKSYSGDRSTDLLAASADDAIIVADGVDATRVAFAITDRFGEPRCATRAVLDLDLDGPGVLVGEPRFDLEPTGAVGAVWVRGRENRPGLITLRASHPMFGSVSAEIASVGP